MTPERYQQIGTLYHAALELDDSQRSAFLDQACDGDEALRREVESLIASHEQAGSFMKGPAVEEAARMLVANQGESLAGQRLGHYEVLVLLGAGGMGEVYLAHDTSLGRQVAIKLLSSRFTSDKDRLRRFQQEARAASALNHPNILTIHEIGQADSAHFIATEFIDGVTLRQRMVSRRMTILEALDGAVQVASALAAAHQAGIAHRDIKPENIMLRPDGYVKVLDFGLAKLAEKSSTLEAADGESPTRALINTEAGMVMGTVSYMSPEQVRGLVVDARTDIWSLGVVLYEMIAGDVPFEGATSSDVIVSILAREPPPLALYLPEASAELQRIVKKALRKDREERYQTAKDMALDLKNLRRELEIEAEAPGSEQPSLSGAASVQSGSQASLRMAGEPMTRAALNADARLTSNAGYVADNVKRRKRVVALALTALAVAALGLGLYRFLGQYQTRSSLGERFQKMTVTKLAFNSNTQSAAISPDGKYVVYTMNEAGKQSIWVRQVTIDSNIRIVPPSDDFHWGLTFSPDNNYVYYAVFESNDKTDLKGPLYQVPTLGGTAKRVIGDVYSRVAFSPDGKRMAFIGRDAAQKEDVLLIANANGTGEQKLASRKYPDNISPGSAPAWSPDGGVIAYAVGSSDANGPYVNVIKVRIADGAEQIISPHRWQWVKQMAWLSDASGLIMTAIEQEESFAHMWYLSYPGGEARRITNDLSNYYIVSITADSSALVTVQNQLLSNVWIAPKGETNHATQITNGSGRYLYLSWMPDGKILYASDASGSADIWEMEADGTGRKQLTAGAHRNYAPAASLDGHYIVFQSDRTGTWQIWRMDRDGSNLKQLTDSNEGSSQPQFLPDGQWVVYRHSNGIWKVSNNGGAPAQLTNQPSMQPTISPDGKWIAYWYYQTQENSLWRLAIIPPEGGRPIKIFDLPPTVKAEMNAGVLGNSSVGWTADGRALTYIDTRNGIANIWSQPVDGGKPVQLTDFKDNQIFSFDWSRDGKLLCSRGTEINDVVLIRDSK